MIKNGKDYDKETLTADVCIVGSGPAGITIAWELINKDPSLRVIILDGSRDTGNATDYWKQNWPNKVWLYDGLSDGLFTHNEPNFLILPNNQYPNGVRERERTYGGTSAHWGGQSRPLDPITFEGVPGYDGWPVTYDEMAPYYSRAADLCRLDGDNFTAEYWAGKTDGEVPHLTGFNAEMYQFIAHENLNFATRTFGEDNITIGDSPVLVIRNASLLLVNHTDGSVDSLQIASMSDDGDPPSKQTEFTVKATSYVLAMGAVANARQMLLSNIKNDNIGRHFMCHPLVANYLDNQGNPIFVSGEYLSAGESRLMSGNITPPPNNGVTVQGRFIPNAEVTRENDIGRCWFWAGTGGNGFYFEQSPNPNSRITLTDTTDPVFGQKQTHIHWEFNEHDEKTYNTVIALFEKAIQKINPAASLTSISWDELKSRVVVNGHHMGTTRMSTSAENGVVDKNLCSHDLDNLYVAGSSVWPSAGISNPTFSIIAFSIRLADYLNKAI